MKNLFSICCVICAACLAANGRDGWGWLLLVALMCWQKE